MAAPKVGINQRSFRQKLAEYRHQPLSLFLLIATLLAAAITVFILFSLIIYILVKGIPAIRPEMFAWKYTTSNNSMMPSIINTLEMVVLTLIMAVPVGVCSAIYLVEYAKRGNKLVKVVRMTTETLQGMGEGLLIFENVVLPFSNPIPKNTQLYKIMTTRLSEVVEL